MKTTTKIIALALLSAIQVHAETITLYVKAADPEVVRSATITLQSNELAQVRYASGIGEGVGLFVNDGTGTYFLSVGAVLPIISGPATIYLETRAAPFGGGGTNSGVCTVSVARLGDQQIGNFVPSNAVVIPADSGGSAQIILESSVDLVTWSAAMPGTYGAQTQKRFFRVRAQH